MRSLTETRGSARIAACGVLTALALIFSYIEFLVPLPIAIPGIKLGLANIVCLVCLYALAGGVVSFAVMVLLKRTKRFSVCGVSMAGGVFHNLAQLAVAGLLVESAQVFYYFPVLLLSGMATGIGIGILATLILRSIARDALL